MKYNATPIGALTNPAATNVPTSRNPHGQRFWDGQRQRSEPDSIDEENDRLH
jgi:hypothetical protein